MAHKIVPLIPKHTVYVEPFAGGSAILFAKPWPDVTNGDHYREVINDLDGELVNFYRQLRDNGPELCRQLQLTPYSEEEYRIAKNFDCDDLERARRYYINSQQSFGNVFGRGWGRGLFGRNLSVTWLNKITRLPEYLDRMMPIAISNVDAIKCIQQCDSPQSFFYVDPPYPGTDQNYKHKYSIEQFSQLVDTLDSIDGSFILSCYNVKVSIPANWEKFEFSSIMSAANGKNRKSKKRTEVVYRKVSKVPVRKELQKLYDAGKFACFEQKGKIMAEIRVTVDPTDTNALRAASDLLLKIAGEPVKEVIVNKPPAMGATNEVIIDPPPPPDPVAADWPRPVNGVMVDSAGLPWDARIHNGNKKCTARAGTWMYRRGGDKDAIPGVEAELRAAMATPVTPAAAPVATEPPPPPPEPVAVAPMSFPEFIQYAGTFDDKYRTQEGLNELCTKVGLPSIGLLASQPHKIPELIIWLNTQ